MSITSLIENSKVVIFDADGCLIEGGLPIEGAIEVTNKLKKLGKTVIVYSNNSTKHPRSMIEFYKSHKFTLDNVINSGFLMSEFLISEKISKVEVVGEEGLEMIIREAGITITSIEPQAVVVGMDRDLNYQKIASACHNVRKGARFFATNPDKTFPTPRGLEPGAGTMIAALTACTDQNPEIIVGKPNEWGFQYIMERYDVTSASCIMIGDRYETDILGALNAGIKGIIVNTGVAKTRENPSTYQNYPKVPVVQNLMELVSELI